MAKLIELNNLTVQRDNKAIFANLNLVLDSTDRLAIVGQNGAGKTTLLRTIVGLESVLTGEVKLFGAVCTKESEFRQYRLRIGFLFQDSDDQLFCPSVIEDVAFGPCNTGKSDQQAQQIARQTLEKLGIEHLADRLSHKLSGGEKRLVCLAGLLAMQPDVLLLDEPTNGVDSTNGKLLRQALLDFNGAILMVSHDEQFIVDVANRAMIMRDGSLINAEIHQHPHTHDHVHIHAIG